MNQIRPSVQPLFATELRNQPEQLKLTIIGAEYSLQTGVVEFFD